MFRNHLVMRNFEKSRHGDASKISKLQKTNKILCLVILYIYLTHEVKNAKLLLIQI